MRPISTESQIKVENNGKDIISLTQQKNECLADSSEHSTRIINATNRKKIKISPLSAHPRDIHERSTYSEGEKEVTNNAQERSLNKQQTVNKDESKQNVIGTHENKNNSLSSESKKELGKNTEENSLNEQQNGDNIEKFANFESIGENVSKSNENNSKAKISPVQQKDESLLDGLDYSTPTDKNKEIKTSENKNNSLSSNSRDSNKSSKYSEGEEELQIDTKHNSLLEQQNGNKVDDPEYLDSTEENVINTSENIKEL